MSHGVSPAAAVPTPHEPGDPLEVVIEGGPHFDWRVVVRTVLTDRLFVHYLPGEAEARAFFEQVKREGYMLKNGMRVTRHGLNGVSLEGPSGLTIRPAPAVLTAAALAAR